MWMEKLSESKLFLGIMILITNIGSRHLVDEFSTSEEEYSRNLVLRRIAVFGVCFAATRDIITSLLLTAGFVILASGISSRSREGMKNKETPKDPGGSKAENPAYDPKVPMLFTT